MTPEEVLNKAVEIVGGQTALANALSVKTGRGIRQQHIWNWLNRDGGLPAAYAPLVQSLCEEYGGSISCNDLCPEFYPMGASDPVPAN
jgi:DNA-binding transcriptional regulator YdaS (Cro superfamily)